MAQGLKCDRALHPTAISYQTGEEAELGKYLLLNNKSNLNSWNLKLQGGYTERFYLNTPIGMFRLTYFHLNTLIRMFRLTNFYLNRQIGCLGRLFPSN